MKITKCIIPAAGMGTRFLPATKAQPKEMLTIVDKPVIQYLVEEAVSAGIKDIIIVTNENKRAIEDHFDRSFELEEQLRRKNKTDELRIVEQIGQLANIAYVRQPFALGDGDALLRAQPFIGDDPFLVLFGDDLIAGPVSGAAQLIESFDQVQAPVIGIETVLDHQVSSYGIVESLTKKENLHQISRILEKPNAQETTSRLGVIGKYVLTADIWKYLHQVSPGKDGEIRLADAFALMVSQSPLYARVLSGTRYDTGDKLGFLKATVDFALQNPKLAKDFRDFLLQKNQEQTQKPSE